MIVRMIPFDDDTQVIAGEGGSVSGVRFVRVEGEDAKGAAVLGTAERGGFGFAEGAQFAGAAFDGLMGHLIGKRGGAGAGALRIGKDMKVSEREALDERQRGGVIFFPFARKTGDDVGADGGVRKKRVDELDAAGIVFDAIPAVHSREDAIGAGLQRHVKVLGKAIICGKKLDEILSDVERLDGADAEALDGRFVEDAAEQFDKLEARREFAAPGAEIDAAQNDFAEAGAAEAAEFVEDALRWKAAGFAADERDDTEGAAGIASVLNFEGWASVIAFPAEDGSDEDFGLGEDVAD